MLKISLLGHPTITHNDDDIELKRRKALALVAYLAVTDKTHSRDSLTTIFFSEQDEKQARSGLRLLLTDINKTPISAWLVVDRNTIALRQDDTCFIDVRRFLDLLADSPTPDAMRDAIALYDDHFMKGFTISGGTEFDNWQITQNQRLQKKMIGALEKLVTYQIRTNAVSDAIPTLERWLTIDPYYEVAQRQLMRAYVAVGQRAAALRQYDILAELLDQDIGEPPQPQTTALHDAIRANEDIALQEYDPPVFGNLPPVPAFIVGRQAVLESLRERVIGQKSALHILQGWPGIGKTTLSAMLAHDPFIHTHFADGVLWTSLGEMPDTFAALSVWANALKVDTSTATSVEALTARLTAALKSKQMLVIIDDAWDVSHVNPFRVGGTQCATLVTTRLNKVAQSLAVRPEHIYKVPILDAEKSVELLHTLAPAAVGSNPEGIRELVHDLEGLPLALQVAGRLLRSEMSMGWGVDELLTELRDDARLLAETAPADRLDSDDDVPLTIEALLRKSTDLLDDMTRQRFALLGVFAPKPAFFDLDAMQAVWNADNPKSTVRTLVERGLLEPASDGNFQIHALLVMHAKSMFG